MNQQNDLKQIATNLGAVQTANLVSVIEEIHHELTTVPKSVIPEIEFKEHFLDYLFNPAAMAANGVLLLKWLELARGAFNEVDVMDSMGNIIFTVPAIYIKPSINQDIINNNDFSGINAMYNLKANHFQAEGINFLNNALTGVSNSITAPETNVVSRWQNIYNYYYGVKVETKQQQMFPLQDDMFKYD
jgi:hypothetical protein